MSTLSLKKIRSRGNAAGLAAAGAPGQFVASRSSGDYAARGVRGDPRGRKFGTGPGATNPILPARAEGKNGSARPPGTHKLRCIAWRDGGIRASCDLQSG